MLLARIDKGQENVEGVAWLKPYKGSARVVGRKSPRSLYGLAHITLRGGRGLRSADTEGYIKLNAPRLHLAVAIGLHADTPQRCSYFSRGVVDADVKALAHRPQGLIDLLDLRAVAQIEEPIHLGRMPA